MYFLQVGFNKLPIVLPLGTRCHRCKFAAALNAVRRRLRRTNSHLVRSGLTLMAQVLFRLVLEQGALQLYHIVELLERLV